MACSGFAPVCFHVKDIRREVRNAGQRCDDLFFPARCLGEEVEPDLAVFSLDLRNFLDIGPGLVEGFTQPNLGVIELPFGGSRRRPTSETTYLDRWGGAVPWT